MLDTSDAHGRYSFRALSPALTIFRRYTLVKEQDFFSLELQYRTTQLCPIRNSSEPRLDSPLLPETDVSSGDYVSISGTDIAVFTKGEDEVILDSVPAGIIPQLRYINDGSVVLRNSM